jgi:hypothetical protein
VGRDGGFDPQLLCKREFRIAANGFVLQNPDSRQQLRILYMTIAIYNVLARRRRSVQGQKRVVLIVVPNVARSAAVRADTIRAK